MRQDLTERERLALRRIRQARYVFAVVTIAELVGNGVAVYRGFMAWEWMALPVGIVAVIWLGFDCQIRRGRRAVLRQVERRHAELARWNQQQSVATMIGVGPEHHVGDESQIPYRWFSASEPWSVDADGVERIGDRIIWPVCRHCNEPIYQVTDEVWTHGTIHEGTAIWRGIRCAGQSLRVAELAPRDEPRAAAGTAHEGVSGNWSYPESSDLLSAIEARQLAEDDAVVQAIVQATREGNDR